MDRRAAIALTAVGLWAAQGDAESWQAKVDPSLLSTPSGVEAEFLVLLARQADLRGARPLPTKDAKGAFVYQQLSRTAAVTQGPVLSELAALGVEHRAYWVCNMIWVRARRDVVKAMAARDDVAHVHANPAVRLREPRIGRSRYATGTGSVEWNIVKVGAPDAWATGITGQGVVVGGQDTGYQWDHPALMGHYRGSDGASADHNYNWHDAIHSGGGRCGADSPSPCDDLDHGTHTMGTLVGDDGAGNQIGMAPGATWIGCRNMDQNVGSPSTYSECFQWFIAPTDLAGENPDPGRAPDVIANSWYCPPEEGCTDPEVLRLVVENTRAAGILVVVAGGNDGPACASAIYPPAIYDAALSVGATDAGDAIAGFSSRGPVTIDGSNRTKPDVSAPGVDIRSSVPGGGYQGGWSGTSMATPHVAGLAALLISADPALRGNVDAIEARIEQTALPLPTTDDCGVPGDAIPNNTFGYGRVRFTVGFAGDVDDSGLVDGWDLILLALSFGRSTGDPGFDARADFDRNGIVDGSDLAALSANFGKRRADRTSAAVGVLRELAV